MFLEYIKNYYFFIIVFLFQFVFLISYYILWKKGYLKEANPEKKKFSI